MFELGDERYSKLLDGEFPQGLGIQVYRKIVGWTQQELADELGVTTSCVSSWENGRVSVSPERMASIAQVLGVSPARLARPDVDDVERASHMALYKGLQVHRMVLSVDHNYEDSKWPEQWREPEVPTLEDMERFWETHSSRNLTYTPVPRMRVGHNGLFSCRIDGTDWRLTRRPALIDTVYSLDDERITVGLMLRCLRVMNNLKAKDVADVINNIMGRPYINSSSYGNVEYDRGGFAKEIDTKFSLLVGLEDYYKLQRLTIMGLTTDGRVQLKALLENNQA